VIEKTITIFRNKKPKKPKIWTFVVFLGFFKKPKKPRFFKSDLYSPVEATQATRVICIQPTRTFLEGGCRVFCRHTCAVNFKMSSTTHGLNKNVQPNFRGGE